MTTQDPRAGVAARRLEDGPARQARRVGRLVGPTGRAARSVLGTGLRARFANVEDPLAAATAVDALSDRRRAKFFTAVSPALSDAVGYVWQDGLSWPYTAGADRRSFRAPGDVPATARARVDRLRRTAWWASTWDESLTWLTEHGGYVDTGGDVLGHLVASVLDHGPKGVAEEVAGHLVDQLNGRGLPGAMGRHTTVAALVADRPDLWAEVEAMLLGAQRQEGVRQMVLEAVDLAHPKAFARFVSVIAQHGLTRFAATARAVGVWLGEPFGARDRKLLDEVLAQAAPLLADRAAAEAATGSEDPRTVRLGLWALATNDARSSATRARQLLVADDVDLRIVAARHLSALGPTIDADGLLAALRDDDERVRAVAFAASRTWPWSGGPTGRHVLEALVALHGRQAQQETVPVGTWKSVDVDLDPREVADATVHHVGDESPLVLAELAPAMSPHGRAQWAELLARAPRTHRRQLLELVGDRSQWPRGVALDALARERLDPNEAPDLEALLTRSSADLRRGVITLLLSQPDTAAVASAQRLVGGAANQARAGRELAAELVRARRGGAAAVALSQDPSSAPPPPPPVDGGPTPPPVPPPPAASAAEPTEEPVAARAEGPPPGTPVSALVDHAARTRAVRPTPRTGSRPDRHATAAALVVTSMEAWLAEHADLEVQASSFGAGTDVHLLSNLRWIRRLLAAKPWDDQAALFPLREVVDPWWERTAPQLGDDASVAVVLATAALEAASGLNPFLWGRGDQKAPRWADDLLEAMPAGKAVGQGERTPITHGLLAWVAARELSPEAVTALLDVAEANLAGIPEKVVRRTDTAADLARLAVHARGIDWRDRAAVAGPLAVAGRLEAIRPQLFTGDHRRRLVAALRWLDEPLGMQPSPRLRTIRASYRGLPDRQVPDRPTRRQLPLRLACRAVDEGAATEADVVELLAGERCPEDQFGRNPLDDNRQHPLAECTRRALPADLAAFPWLAELVDRVRDAILDVELHRGELPTPMTAAAMQLRTMVGADRVVQALAALGSQKFVRGYVWGGQDSKRHALSKLVRVSFPAPDDTPERFAQQVDAAGIKPARLLDLAVYAPQWAATVEAVVDRPGLADAIRWLHAHTKDDRWQVDPDVRAEWMAQVQEQTPLTGEDLVAGAVDVAWFERVRATLGDEHFTGLLKAAKYASSAGGHKRAELFARALRGEVGFDELVQRAEAKRHQDTVRAVGLVPLPTGPDEARQEVLRRWSWLQDWAKGSKQFGQQKRASEALAVRVATDNLARTAGYADPQRLTWAMEAEAVRDLAEGALVATADDVTLTLRIDEAGAPCLEVERAGRRLKNVPKKVAKDEAITELKDRARTLREQARRMRRSLEEAMVRGDAFSPAEFAELREHAVLRPMLDALLVVDEAGTVLRPAGDGFVDETSSVARASGGLRVAHPVDLLASGHWHDWQHRLFSRKVRQPCKQVFRELYVLTDAERRHGTRSQRYAGQQVQPSQASGIFGSRGWVVSPEGEALRTFHDQDVTAHVTVMLGAHGTPAEVEDTPVEDVVFTRRGSWDLLQLDEVPPRLFSEVMRDVDLVVSVAHSGGYDPEASASSVEVRAAIVRETADLLGIDNVEVTDHHAMVRGTLGSYSVHLGSGTVHKRPGNAVCIIAVGAQQRGRIFLPFVDDDPRTAEIVSKVVLLARDDKIKDPSILEQIR